MFTVLRNRNFTLFWSGQLISIIGDLLLFVALPFYIYTLTGSTLATGTMTTVQILPQLFLSSIAGVFIDRWNRKYTLVIANFIQMAVLIPLLFMHSKDMIWLAYVFAFVASCVSQFTIAASNALLPNLVKSEQLLQANSLNSVGMELTRLVGPLLGGILMGLLGLHSAVMFDIVSFFCVAVMLSFVKIPELPIKEEIEPAHTRARLQRLGHEWLDGIKVVKSEKIIYSIFLVFGVSMIAEGILSVLLTPWVKTILHGDALTFGWIASAQAIGGILGSGFLTRLSAFIKPSRMIPLSGILVGILIFAIMNIPILWLDLLLAAMLGVVAIGFFVSLFALLQNRTTDAYRGRVIGAFVMVQAFTTLIGTTIASTLGDHIGIVSVMDIAAVCDILAGGLSLLVIRQLDPTDHPQETKKLETAARREEQEVSYK